MKGLFDFFERHAALLKTIEIGPWGLARKFRGAYRPITAFYEFERKLGEAMNVGIVEYESKDVKSHVLQSSFFWIFREHEVG